MKAEIAVVTVSGRAYYLLVNELKRRNISFLSLTPNDNIPTGIKAVITTKSELPGINHPIKLAYEKGQDLAQVVDEAILMTKGKTAYKQLVVGIDPGRNFGIAVLGDGIVLETQNCRSLLETIKTIKALLRCTPASQATIRIGDGAPSHVQDDLGRLLDFSLPKDIIIESVKEEGTSRPVSENSHRRGKRDVSSAIRIGQRQGHRLPRKGVSSLEPH